MEPARIVVEEKPISEVGPLGALLKITTTTICGTDVHIPKGAYPVEKSLIVGHEPVRIIERLGSLSEIPPLQGTKPPPAGRAVANPLVGGFSKLKLGVVPPR